LTRRRGYSLKHGAQPMPKPAAELFELVEEAFDEIALAIERLLPAEPSLAPDHVGNVGDGAAGLEMLPEPIGVVGLVGD